MELGAACWRGTVSVKGLGPSVLLRLQSVRERGRKIAPHAAQRSEETIEHGEGGARILYQSLFPYNNVPPAICV